MDIKAQFFACFLQKLAPAKKIAPTGWHGWHVFATLAEKDDFYLYRIQIPLQAETDDLYQRCANFDNVAKEANATSDRMDAEIRDLSKKVSRASLSVKILRDQIEKTPTHCPRMVSTRKACNSEFFSIFGHL